MKISDIITKDKIIPELRKENKEGIINELIDLFENDKRVYDIDALRKDIFKREKIMSTGIGEGLAIPHCTTEVVKDYIAAFGKSSVPVDFKSIDHKPAYLFFLIAGNNVKEHMQLLSKVAKLMNNKFKEDLLKANNADDIQLIFQKLDNKVIELRHI